MNAAAITKNATLESALVAEHLPLIRNLARRHARSSWVPFDDLVQEGSIAFVASVRRWDASCGVPLWAFARRRVIGQMMDYATAQLSKAGLENTFDVDYNEGTSSQACDDTGKFSARFRRQMTERTLIANGTPETKVSADECLQVVRDCLFGMTDLQQDVVRLRLEDDLGFREIADELGIPKSTVSDIYQDAMGAVREHLEQVRA